jgi:hypothetical protein
VGPVLFLRVLNPLSAWQVLGELVGDKNLEKFRIEYEKLHRCVNRGEQMSKRVEGEDVMAYARERPRMQRSEEPCQGACGFLV